MAEPEVPPAGTFPAGFLVPVHESYSVDEIGIAADAIDPVTGEYLSISQGFDPLDAWVLGQFAVVRGSGSAVMNDGRDFSDVTHIGERYREIFRQEILRAVQPMIDGQLIEVVRLKIDEGENSYLGYFTYRHTSNGEERTAVVKPGALLAGGSS